MFLYDFLTNNNHYSPGILSRVVVFNIIFDKRAGLFF
jgi:hypothetical protein